MLARSEQSVFAANPLDASSSWVYRELERAMSQLVISDSDVV
jgi:hypothetical protein